MLMFHYHVVNHVSFFLSLAQASVDFHFHQLPGFVKCPHACECGNVHVVVVLLYHCFFSSFPCASLVACFNTACGTF